LGFVIWNLQLSNVKMFTTTDIFIMAENENKFPQCYGIIPARYQSTRFPGKALAEIAGRPMVWHVFNQARQCPELSSVVLATDDDRIRSVAEKHEIPVVMTRDDHPSGTDRVLEAASRMNLPVDAVVVNIQGDEPALEPSMLTELVGPFSQPEVMVTTLARRIDAREAASPDQVKVVLAQNGTALYFSRSPIPYHRNPQKESYYGHIGLYAFRMPALEKFVTLDQSPLEVTEKLEQLRLLENDVPLHVVLTRHQSIGVDRPEDIEAVEKIISQKGRG
jgi:3-deoxy-manno-octulosonate cytidylyltransferase (CMP-KDO synthetase)